MIVDDKIINYVLYQMRTENEVRKKCNSLKFEEDYIDEAIEYLKEAGYIDDKKYAKKYVENVIRLKHISANEIKIALMRKGVNQDIIDDAVDTEEVYTFEEESCIINAEKKYKSCGDVLKVRKFLVSKGYKYEIINDVLEKYGE